MKLYTKEELDNFDTNITVISFTNLMSKLILGVEEKKIMLSNKLKLLKIYDLIFEWTVLYWLSYIIPKYNVFGVTFHIDSKRGSWLIYK